jgi:hypothetical protein
LISDVLNVNEYSFLDFSESDTIQLESKEWPSDKWDNKLYTQTEITDPEPVGRIINKMNKLISSDHVFIFSMKYNFGLFSIPKTVLETRWRELIDLDGDEIICHLPDSRDFVSIEKTQELILGRETEGLKWIYEVTYPDKELRDLLN